MKKINFCFFFILILLLPAIFLHAQKESTKQNDSFNTAILQHFNTKINQIETERKADSIKKTELENELQSVKASDNQKRNELEKQLNQLENNDSIKIAEKKARIDSLRASAKGFPVVGFFNDTLFLIYSRLGSFSAYDRAAAVSARIHKIANNFHFASDSLKVIASENTYDVVFGENIITSVSENDALWNNAGIKSLAQKYKIIIGSAVVKYKSETSFTTLLKEVGLALSALFILTAIIFYVNKFSKWTAIKIKQQQGKRINGIKIRNYILFDSDKQVGAMLSVNTKVKWGIIILLIYVTLPILFGIFPWTKGFAETLISYFLNPLKKILHSIWNYIPDAVTIMVIVFVFRYILKAINYLKIEVENSALKIPGFYSDWANPTYQIIRVLLYAFMLVIIFPYLPGSNSPVFRGISVFIGVLFTFGSAGALSNVMSGLVLTYMRAFKIGDRIKIGDVTGDIIEKSLLVTRVRTIKNEIVSIPNSNVMSNHTINYSSEALERGLIVHTTVTIGYDVPWKDMHKALINAAMRTQYILHQPAPFVMQTSLDDFYVSYQINGYIKEANEQAMIYSDLHQNIQDCCFEAGIEILSPHYTSARDGNAAAIPPDYLGKDYKAPGFNININKENK